MPAPSQEERICAMFDSFCKTVSKNFIRNLRRDAARKQPFVEEPTENVHKLVNAHYCDPFDAFILYVDDHSCVVESEILYYALLSLSENQRKVLLLDFWRDLTDEEISLCLGITTRTVYNLRRRAYGAIREYYGHEHIPRGGELHPY